MTKPKEYDLVVPLHLIPVTIAQRIRERGGKLYRISVVRTHEHHYTVKCKCRAKIAMEPLEDHTDRPVNPGPAQVSGISLGNAGPEPVSSPSRENPAPELVSGTASGNPGPEPVSGQSNGKTAPEPVSGTASGNPGPESPSEPSRENPEPDPLCGTSTVNLEPEPVSDITTGNPRPGPLSGQQSMAGDDA